MKSLFTLLIATTALAGQGGHPAGKGASASPKMVIVNEKGEPCMFYAKLN